MLISPPLVVAAPFPASHWSFRVTAEHDSTSHQSVPTLQEPPPDKSLSVRDDNRRTAELHLTPEAVADSRREVTAASNTVSVSTSPPSKAIATTDYDAVPQDRQDMDSHLQQKAVRDLLPSAGMTLIGDYGKTILILHPLVANSSTKKDDNEIRWDTSCCGWMSAFPKEDVSSLGRRRVPLDTGWLILDTGKTLRTLPGKHDLGTDEHGSLLFGCFLFSPSLGGHGYRPMNISGRWFEATPQGEKFKWLVANFGLDSSPPLRCEMVKMPLVPVLKKNRWVTRHLFPSEVCYPDDLALHPAGAWGQLQLLRVLSVFGATGLQVSLWPLLNTRKALRPLNPVMEESLWQQIGRQIEHWVVEEADSPWSFPLVPVPKKNSREVRWLIDHQRRDAITEKDALSQHRRQSISSRRRPHLLCSRRGRSLP